MHHRRRLDSSAKRTPPCKTLKSSSRIEALVAEEHALLDETAGEEGATDKHKRLRDLQVSLDQCWDLLRQRRARRHAGEDPESAQPRDASTVERYKQ